MTVAETIDALQSLSGVELAEEGGWRLVLRKEPQTRVEVFVPYGTLHWFATAYGSMEKVQWNEEMDYAGYEPEATLGTLEQNMCEDLHHFVGSLANAEAFRARRDGVLFLRIIPEVQVGGQWQELRMSKRPLPRAQ